VGKVGERTGAHGISDFLEKALAKSQKYGIIIIPPKWKKGDAPL
jgi:hypothetical protein